MKLVLIPRTCGYGSNVHPPKKQSDCITTCIDNSILQTKKTLPKSMTPPVWWNVVKNPNRLTKSVAPDFSTPITLGPHFYCHGHIWFATKAQQTSPGPGMRNENRAIYRTSFQSSHWILCFWLKTTMIRKKTMISYDKQQSSGGNYPLVNIQKTMERSTMFNG